MGLPLFPRKIRVLGIDDAPFAKRSGARVDLAGVVCAGTRMEGMLWGHTRRDGRQATEAILRMLEGSRALPQLHLILLDGLGFGGLNLVDLPRLAQTLGLPCVAVMRRRPDMDAFTRAIRKLPRPTQRLALVERAGPIYEAAPFVYQVQGLNPEETAAALARVTEQGHVPEALRLAHMIGRAVKLGESKGGA